jgi:hypothetical protein
MTPPLTIGGVCGCFKEKLPPSEVGRTGLTPRTMTMNKFFEATRAGQLLTTAELLVLCSIPLIVMLYGLVDLVKLMR